MRPCVAIGVVLCGMAVSGWGNRRPRSMARSATRADRWFRPLRSRRPKPTRAWFRSTTSGTDGGYILTALPVGPYRLEITKDGFTKSVESGVVLQVNHR